MAQRSEPTAAGPGPPAGSSRAERNDHTQRRAMSTATTHRYDTSRYRAPAGLTEHSPALLRFTIANPPINLFDPDVYAELRRLVDRMQADPELRVVIFDSADPDYFISHLDVARLSDVPDRPGPARRSHTGPHTVTRL